MPSRCSPPAWGLDARQVLVDYHSPGNVRELKNILERAAILADGGLIVTEHLALAPRPRISGEGQAASSDLSAVERAMIGKALQDARCNKSAAAKALGLTRASSTPG
jgi:transcriptional regulator of acetoin/glycerol metabolism